jgi:hypothetical protein
MKKRFLVSVLTVMVTGCGGAVTAYATNHSGSQNLVVTVSTSQQSIIQKHNYSVGNQNQISNIQASSKVAVSSTSNHSRTITFIGQDGSRTVLPVIGIPVQYTFSNTRLSVLPPHPLPAQHFNIPKKWRNQLALFWMNSGDNKRGLFLLAPKTWKVTSARIGVDGSTGFTIKDPKSNNRLRYSFYGACYGCTLDAASQYFPGVQPLTPTPPPPIFRQKYFINKHAVFYQLDPEDNGVAVFDNSNEGMPMFMQEEVHLPAGQSDLAKTMLMYFASHYKYQ